jgi:Kef-type K+ transport system membrane component KefB
MSAEFLGKILLELLVILILAKGAGWLCHKVGQSAVLGELLVGMLLGPSVLHFIDPGSEIIIFLAELGVIILLFEVGIESNIYKLLKVGLPATLVGIVGVVIPLLGGYFYYMTIDGTTLVALFVGATLTATSVGITMRIFSEKGKLDTDEGKIILGAAVIDDILGLIILSIVVSIAEVGKVSIFNVGKVTFLSILFLVGSIYLGIKLAPRIMKLVHSLKIKRIFAVTAMVFALGLSWLAYEVGLATIVGAFAAGLILETTEEKEHIKDRMKPLADIFIPLFFVHAGLMMNLQTLTNTALFIPIGILLVIAILGKVLGGYVAIGAKVNKLVVGIGMIPRGEVGLIFAAFGLSNAIIGEELYALLVVVIMLTTFIAPPLLSWSMRSMEVLDGV